MLDETIVDSQTADSVSVHSLCSVSAECTKESAAVSLAADCDNMFRRPRGIAHQKLTI